MSRRRRNETEEQRARRELISYFLSAANIQSMDDIQELFKEALAGFMEGSLESELDSELGYEPYMLNNFIGVLSEIFAKNDAVTDTHTLADLNVPIFYISIAMLDITSVLMIKRSGKIKNAKTKNKRKALNIMTIPCRVLYFRG